MRIAIIFGTRPELIKLASVIHRLRRLKGVRVITISTGQHQEMLEAVLPFFEITTDIKLSIMAPGQTLSELLAAAIRKLDAVIQRLPTFDVMIGQGDTTTALAASLVAFTNKIPFLHVEAGLRSHDVDNPFPEEHNRVLISHTAMWHLAPTRQARDNLLREGIASRNILVTGNTVVDAVCWARRKIACHDVRERIGADLKRRGLNLDGITRFVLVTAHRRENFGRGLRQICFALKKIAKNHADLHLVWPVHLNPNVQKVVRCELAGESRIHCLPPLDYPTLLYLLSRCHLVLTDSGGIQEEAPSFHKPVLVMRETTERPEVLRVGAGQLVGTDARRITRAVARLMRNPVAYAVMASASNPFGDGRAAEHVARLLTSGRMDSHFNTPRSRTERR